MTRLRPHNLLRLCLDIVLVEFQCTLANFFLIDLMSKKWLIKVGSETSTSFIAGVKDKKFILRMRMDEAR